MNDAPQQMHVCQDCGKKWPESKLKDIHSFHERVSPGEVCPSGECPECGALCHPEAAKPYVLVTVSGGVADLAMIEPHGEVDVDILDYDDLKLATPEDVSLSDSEWEYLKRHDSELYRRLHADTEETHRTRDHNARLLLQQTNVHINGLTFPKVEDFPKFCGLEMDSDGVAMWAFFDDSRKGIAIRFEGSETEAVARRECVDLDTGEVVRPVYNVVSWAS